MKIRFLCVGKVKESGYREACAEYLKRIGRFCGAELHELPEYNIAGGIKKEGQEILKRVKGSLITLEIEGKQMSSPEFSEFVGKQFLGTPDISFAIGGSEGLSDEVKAASSFALSFGAMTYPHTLMRVMLLEQVYRAMAIAGNLPYHK